MPTIINKTPHEVVVDVMVTEELGKSIRFPTQGDPIRLDETREVAFMLEDIPVTRVQYHAANHLPRYQPGVFYIVSLIVAKTYPDRADFIVPGKPIRDLEGNIIACEGFSTVVEGG